MHVYVNVYFISFNWNINHCQGTPSLPQVRVIDMNVG